MRLKQLSWDDEVFLAGKFKKVSPKLVDIPKILAISQKEVLTPEDLARYYRDFIEKLAPEKADSYCLSNGVLDEKVRYAIQFFKLNEFKKVKVLGFNTLERLMWDGKKFAVKIDGREVEPIALGAPSLLVSLEDQIKSIVAVNRNDFIAFCSEKHADTYCTSEPEDMLDGSGRARYAVQYSNIHPR